MVIFRNNCFYFEEKNKYYKSLNKFINKLSYKYSFLNNYDLEDTSLQIVEEIYFFCSDKCLDINNIDKDSLKMINSFLRRRIHYLFNEDLETKVVYTGKKNERIYIINKESSNNYDYFEEDSVELRGLFENKEDSQSDLSYIYSDKIKDYDNIEKKDMISIRDKYKQEEIYTFRYSSMLRDCEKIEKFVKNKNFNDKNIEKLKEDLSEFFYNNINDEIIDNKALFLYELYNFISFVKNYKYKYRDNIKKGYNFNKHVKEIKKVDKNAKIFYVLDNVIVDYK